MTDLQKFPNAQSAAWSSGNPTIAPSGATFLSGVRWKGWQSCLAMAVLKDQHLRILCFNGTGTSVTTQTEKLTDLGRLRVAVLNRTNNNLYIATDANPGKILRVVPS
jgi:glucose/arabinose dehydrogenase